MLGAMDAEEPEPSEEPRVAEYLAEWLEVQRTQVQPSTWSSYRGNVDRYLTPHLGGLRLDEITVAGLNRLYSLLLRRGGYKGKALSLRTVELAHTVLRKALEDARRLDLIAVNPALDATLPRVDPRDGTTVDTSKVNAWTAEELRTFFAHIAGHRWEPHLTVAATTGVRRGELLGITWEDVDTERGLLHVRHALSVVDGHAILKGTKTERPRTLHLDARTVEAFREQRSRQDRWRQEAQAGWRNGWDLVFTMEDGRYIHPNHFGVEFIRLVEAAPVPRIRLHDLRHTHATLLLGEGVPIKVVSERLGHSEVSITLDVYAHCLPAMDQGAAEQFAGILWDEGPEAETGP
jgi:integrase